MKIRRKPQPIQHRFIDVIEGELEPGVLYVSIRLKNAVHMCPCGCGRKVYTPIAPDGWTLSFNGREVSLFPSIGNWLYECRSHYFIKANWVQWCLPEKPRKPNNRSGMSEKVKE
jgi:hypothetical protein